MSFRVTSRVERPALEVWTECSDELAPPESEPAGEERFRALDSPEKVRDHLRRAGFRDSRVWTEELVTPLDLDHVVELRSRSGAQARRFESLEEGDRRTCVDRARRRLRDRPREDFVTRAELVYAVAR